MILIKNITILIKTMPFIKIKYCVTFITMFIIFTMLLYFNYVQKETENGAIIKSKLLQTVVTKKNRVFFLKSHKCASSTIQNILMRFGHNENLDFLVPNVANYIGNPIHFNNSMVFKNYSTTDGQFDMFVHHTRYSQNIKSVMRPGTIYITILREPATLFQSIYSFYHFNKKYKTNLTEFINRNLFKKIPEKYIERYNKRLGINQMSWDLGLEAKDFDNIEMINKHIHMVENDFHFIMIFEYFDASLVLFANLMQWPLEKVAYLPLNVKNKTYQQKLSNFEINQLKKVNMADNMLYNQFIQKFRKKIKDYGLENLKREIGKLITINQEIKEKCVESTINKGYANTISYTIKENTNRICKYIAMDELKYTTFIRNIQHEKYRKYKELDKLMKNK